MSFKQYTIKKNPSDHFFLLSQIPNSPTSCYLLGSLQAVKKPCIAIVGSRKASSLGREIAFSLAKTLSQKGYAVVSGLARGVDTAAHFGAIEGGGHTIGVLAHGFKYCYPSENKALAKLIVQKQGCLLSEYAWGQKPRPHQFPERNRIISGLCAGVVIVEAHPKSGSLITARFALEQNRSVMVVPGRINDISYLGSNQLIQQGARSILSCKDVVEEIDSFYRMGFHTPCLAK